MNGPMFVILTSCILWNLLKDVEVKGDWKSRVKFAIGTLTLYLVIGFSLIFLYYEVVLRWLVF
jgi:hypothetical protein